MAPGAIRSGAAFRVPGAPDGQGAIAIHL